MDKIIYHWIFYLIKINLIYSIQTILIKIKPGMASKIISSPSDYTVISSTAVSDTHRDDRTGAVDAMGLITIVNSYIQGGWVPLGGMTVLWHDDGYPYFYQSMIKYDD